MKQFTNPYDGYVGETSRLNAVIPIEKFNRVKRCRLTNGTVQNTLAILWEKLINELDRRNITDCTDAERFEQFVAGCQLVGGNGVAFTEPLPKTAIGNDGRGIEGMGDRPTNEANVGANVPSESPKGKRRLGGNTKRGTEKKEKGVRVE